MTRFPLILALLASPAMAADERVWPDHMAGPEGDSYVRIDEPTVSHAVATVTFQNRPVHNGADTFELTYEDVTVTVHLGFNVDTLGSERITVEPPSGYIAIPPEITVSENQSDVIQIVKYVGG